MPGIPFLRPKLTGRRFENHAVPLEILRDLAVLEEFIVEVAKAQFLAVNTDRRRSPRGFTDGVSLKLTGIEPGSAIPVISLFTAAATLIPLENQSFLEQARDSVVRAIAAADRNEQVHGILPEKTLGYFDRLGRSLQADETIEFDDPDAPDRPARLTRETRNRLRLASSSLREVTDETTIRGTIPEADQDRMTFEVQLADGRKIKAPLSAEHFEPIINAFGNYQQGYRVAVKGIGRFNRSEKLVCLESVEHVTPLDALDVPARLDELRVLKDGWLNGDGKAPAHGGMDWLAEAFTSFYPDALSLPHTFPTIEGGVRFEWTFGRIEVSLDINLQTRHSHWHQLDLVADNDTEESLDLSVEAGWKILCARIQQLGGAVA